MTSSTRRRPRRQMLYGPKRRRVPSNWDVDNPMQTGVGAEPGCLHAGRGGAAPVFLRPYPRAVRPMHAEEFHALTGRRYSRVDTYRCDDADYLILGQGSMTVQAEAVADWLRETRKIKVGVVNLTMFRPFPGDLLGKVLQRQEGRGRAGTHRPAAVGRPAADARSALHRHQMHGERAREFATPDYASYETRQRHAVAVFRLLWPGFARPATGRPDRRGREHAARRGTPQVLLPVGGFRARRIGQSQAGDPPAGIASRLSAASRNWQCAAPRIPT